MMSALEIKAMYGCSYWDAAIVAAARALGCRELLTGGHEPWARGRRCHIKNPFR